MEYRETQWNGMKAVLLRAGDLDALILPDMGANCISLVHRGSGCSLLRTPADPGALHSAPNVYGLPLLFPPNRIREGAFEFEGRRYVFPINEPERNTHIHGVLSALPFAWAGKGRFVFRAGKANPYLHFPHAFTVIREYAPDENGGIRHTVTFVNDSPLSMPLGTGIHAAWRIPFSEEDGVQAYRLTVPVLREWLLDADRKLPAGSFSDNSPLLASLRNGSLIPDAHPLSALLECSEGPVILSGPRGRLICQRDDYRFIMLWNGGGGQGFVCPEPQSWATDAPNLALSWSETGMRAIAPGESASFRLTFSFDA